jgi:rubrerythrin
LTRQKEVAMTESNDRALKMLSVALEMERKGYDFYSKAAESCEEAMGRDIFKMLAKDEVVHIDRIEKIYKAVQSGSWSDEWKELSPGHDPLTAIFREMADKHGGGEAACADDIEALKIGVEFEDKAVTFYSQHLEQAEQDLERQFIEKMIVEERDHHRALADMVAYLTDPESWFTEKEKHGLDGA